MVNFDLKKYLTNNPLLNEIRINTPGKIRILRDPKIVNLIWRDMTDDSDSGFDLYHPSEINYSIDDLWGGINRARGYRGEDHDELYEYFSKLPQPLTLLINDYDFRNPAAPDRSFEGKLIIEKDEIYFYHPYIDSDMNVGWFDARGNYHADDKNFDEDGNYIGDPLNEIRVNDPSITRKKTLFHPSQKTVYKLIGPLQGITLEIGEFNPDGRYNLLTIDGDTWGHDEIYMYLEDDKIKFNGFLDDTGDDYDGWAEDETPEQIKKLELVGAVDFDDRNGEYMVAMDKNKLAPYLKK